MSQTAYLQNSPSKKHAAAIFAEIFLFSALLILFLGQALFLAKHNSTISDEVAHIAAGYTYLKLDLFDLNPEHPPLVKQVAAIPLVFMNLKFPFETQAWADREQWALGRMFLYTLGNPAEEMIFRARAALIGFPLAFGVLLYFVCRIQWGREAAFAGLFICALFPELIAHSLLVATDFAAMLFFFATFYFFSKFYENCQPRYLFLSALAGGLALISKFSMMQMLPLLYVLCFYAAFSQRTETTWKISTLLLGVVTFFALSHPYTAKIFSFPILYFWGKTFFPQAKFFKNPRVHQALALILILFSVMMLVVVIDYFEPASWFHHFRFNPFKRFFRGWKYLRDHSVGLQHEGFLFGEYRHQGWWYYYLTAMLFKIPIPVLTLAGVGIFSFIKKGIAAKNFFLWCLPPLTYFFIASFVNKVNIGVRHALPLYPYIILLAVSGWLWLRSRSSKFIRLALPAGLAIWLILAAFRAFPNDLSYFNEFAACFGGGAKILSDSNIGWGQDLLRLRDYVKKNEISEIRTLLQFNTPDEMSYYKIPFTDGTPGLKSRLPGIYVMDVFSYHSLTRYSEYAWLKTLKPKDQIGGSLWVFEL